MGPCAQVAMGTGYSLFLVDPTHEAVKALEVWEPEEATCEPANPEAAGAAGALAVLRMRIMHGACKTLQPLSLGRWQASR